MEMIKGGVCAAKGFKANGIHCGIRHNRTKRDLALIVSEVPATAAAVYTTNLVKGAPLTVTKNHLTNGKAQAIICNSGNANTCNANGIEIAQSMAISNHHFANYWMHNGYINVNNEKMAKSKGNFFTVREILEKYKNKVYYDTVN